MRAASAREQILELNPLNNSVTHYLLVQLLRERVRLLQESNEQLAQRDDQVTLSFRQVLAALYYFILYTALPLNLSLSFNIKLSLRSVSTCKCPGEGREGEAEGRRGRAEDP